MAGDDLEHKHNQDPLLQRIWEFARGDGNSEELEQWVYSEPTLEERLGKELYLKVISADFANSDGVRMVRELLSDYARQASSLHCQCIRLPNLAVVDMGEESEVFSSLVCVRKRGEPYWWLAAYRCRQCGQYWLMAQESRQNDIYCLRRLDTMTTERLLRENQWPSEFSKYRDLLIIGAEAGRSVRFMDPMHSSLVFTVADLAKETPGITVAEIARLLNIELPLASAIAEKAIKEEGVVIDLKRKEF